MPHLVGQGTFFTNFTQVRQLSALPLALGPRSRAPAGLCRGMLPLCKGNEQNDGVWAELHGARAQKVRRATPPCCNSRRSAPCQRSALLPISSRACTCHGLLRQNITHVWKPSRCRLLPWNASRFCERLGKKQLLFIGDSTMIQHHAMLVNRIVWDAQGSGGGAHDCAAQVSFVHSDTLTMAPQFGRLNRGYPIRKILAGVEPHVDRRPPYDVAIVNTGAHVVSDADFKVLLHYMTKLVPSQFPLVKIVWKVQNPAGCSHTGRPLASPPDEQFYANHAGPTYNWRSFLRRDKLAKAAFNSAARAPQLGGVLDTAPMNLRADAHISSHGALGRPKKPGSIDCLHLCHTADGGPLALGPQLLLHALETRQVFF